MTKFLVSFIILVASFSPEVVLAFGRAATGSSGQSDRVISDSLVKGLRCAELSADTVLSNLQPDAFDSSHNLPIRNWHDAAGIGHCWSLSHAQRLIYFLGHTGREAPLVEDAHELSGIIGNPLTHLAAFDLTSSYFNDESRLRSDLEFYQLARFSNPQNLGLLFGGRDRSESDNEQTFDQVRADLHKNWLPMLVLRLNPVEQHVVLVKGIHDPEADGTVVMDLYDSNLPDMDVQMTYSTTEHEFTAPDYINEITKTSGPVGIFLVDDQDMQKIQDALVAYYSKICAQ